MSKKAMKLALEALEVATTPFARDRQEVLRAQTALREALAEQPAQPNYRRGDRLICLETEEYCVIHISGTDRQWVKFPDTHIGVYKNEQLAELFELLPKEIEFEQPAQQEPVAYAVYHRMGGGKSLHWPEQHSPDGDASEYQLVPLYTTPPAQRKPLTDEQVNLFINGRGDEDDDDYVEPTGDGFGLTDADLVRLVRRVEAAHGIKENS